MNGQLGIDKVIEKFYNKCNFCGLNCYRLILMDIDMPIKDGFLSSLEINKFCRDNNINPPYIAAVSAYYDD